MRIIDKQHDFYDYLQDSNDTLVFDRRGSYIVQKDYICSHLNMLRYYQNSKYRFLIFQCGATYWLLLAIITKTDAYHNATNFEIEVLDTWKNFDKHRELLKLELISFRSTFLLDTYTFPREYDYAKIKSHTDTIRDMINTNDYISECTIFNSNHRRKDYKTGNVINEFSAPIIKASGIISALDPSQVFFAIEEHYSLIKTESERIDPIGITNNDKITSHGFDTKTSFRGK